MHDELIHYGVIGMKWGVRRYQNKDGTRIKQKKTKSTDSSKILTAKAKSFVEKHGSNTVGDGTGRGDTYAHIALSIALYIGAGYGISLLTNKYERKLKKEELNELNAKKKIKNFEEAPRLSRKMSASESVKVTNPDYPSRGTTSNCTFCTTAMALREKGYDVKAAKSDEGWYTDELFKKTFNSPVIKMSKRSTGKDVLNTLASNGDGAYGNLNIAFKGGGLHSVFWKNDGKKTRIYDGQDGTELTKSAKSSRDFMNSIITGATSYNRLDNCEPTEYALAVVESNKK